MRKSKIMTAEAEAYVQAHWKSYMDCELAEFLNKKFGIKATKEIIKDLRFRRGWTGPKGGSRPGRSVKLLPQEAKEMIAWLCTTMNDQELADLVRDKFGLERTAKQIKGWRKMNHVKCGRDPKYKKGHPAGPGAIKKGEHRGRATEFKKGNRVFNTLPVGAEVYVDKGRGYWKRKIAEPNKWQLRSRWVWEQANGPLKKGDMLVHIDGNPENDALDNLRLINQAIMGRINTSQQFHGRELKKDDLEWNQACISIACIEQKLVEAVK